MKKIKSPLVYALAFIGLGALLYGAWTIYQNHVAEEQARAFLSAPASPGLPDPLHAKPEPPPQP
jgi:hypothetical protein